MGPYLGGGASVLDPATKDAIRMASSNSNDLQLGISNPIQVYESAYKEVQDEKRIRLGEGQHGEVWKTEPNEGSQAYAIKLIDIDEPGGLNVAEGEERGFNASRDLQLKAHELAEKCRDDNVTAAKWDRAAKSIVKYLHYGEDWSCLPASFYVVMEYAEGKCLEDEGFAASLTQAQRMSIYKQLGEIIELMSTTQLGMDRAWVHRDIKLGNVIANVKDDGSVDIKVIDLGVIVDKKTKKRNFYRGTNWPWVPYEARKSAGQFIVSTDGAVCGFDMFSLGILILQCELGVEVATVVSNPEVTPDEKDVAIVDEFFGTDLGSIAKQLTSKTPDERLRPNPFLDALSLLQQRN
jgi:serine/threonine protein kinase